ncbi:mitochondrial carnitine/acylcarnitine carrier protein-like [Diabrotica virgifera virgifera]|uniref:Mitochondrial carnitine/acylcarnitine carrier protein-like n=1 Tax=Diabrotica virgifera virgifera TaxID=50390 RepID=A0ABM5ITG7_DIAVI|nr:mitochondrial carnitine/acylcarnitine carrier protein-like [Diabrotica virgifera virgifera]
MSGTSVLESFFCGGFGGICAVLVAHPLDTVKVRLQTMPVLKPGMPPLYLGPWHCIKKSTKDEGFFFVYKGMSAPLIAVTPLTAICFMSFEIGKKIFGPSDGSSLNNYQIFASGMFSGLCTAPLIAPGDRVKCLLQVQKSFSGPLDCVVQLYRKGGVSNIFRGLGATLIRDAPSTGVYFLTYDLIRRQINKESPELDIIGTMCAGGFAAIFCWLLAMPIDVVKSKIQISLEEKHKQGVAEVLKEILKTEGAFGFFRGGTLILTRAFLGGSICFLSFEFCKDCLNSYKKRQNDKKSEVFEH